MAKSVALSREGYNVRTGEPDTLLDLPELHSFEVPHRLCPFLPTNLLPNLSIPLRKNNNQQRGWGCWYTPNPQGWFSDPQGKLPIPRASQWKLLYNVHHSPHLGAKDLPEIVQCHFIGHNILSHIQIISKMCPT